MGIFRIELKNMYWIKKQADDPNDLCLHGDVIVYIGKEKIEYDEATISATALYLLKSLTEDHMLNHGLQMIPCCGFFIIPNDTLDNVEISGCINGVDWSVIHNNDNVILELENGITETISIKDYQSEVLKFADKIEKFYLSCTSKIIPKDDFDRKGYIAFWNEWHRRKNI